MQIFDMSLLIETFVKGSSKIFKEDRDTSCNERSRVSFESWWNSLELRYSNMIILADSNPVIDFLLLDFVEIVLIDGLSELNWAWISSTEILGVWIRTFKLGCSIFVFLTTFFDVKDSWNCFAHSDSFLSSSNLDLEWGFLKTLSRYFFSNWSYISSESRESIYGTIWSYNLLVSDSCSIWNSDADVAKVWVSDVHLPTGIEELTTNR